MLARLIGNRLYFGGILQRFELLGFIKCLLKFLNKGVYILYFNNFISFKTYTTKPKKTYLKYYSCVPENLGKWASIRFKTIFDKIQS